MSRFAQAIALLAATKAGIFDLLNAAEDEAFRIKFTTNIQRDIDYLNLITGEGDLTPVNKVALPPATTIGGQPINKPRRVTRDDLEPEERKVETLRDKIEELYPKFLTIPNKDLLLNYDELVIRGVAKKAKMKVSKDEPAELSLEFIEKIKENVEYMNSFVGRSAAAKVSENENEDDDEHIHDADDTDNDGVADETKAAETVTDQPAEETKATIHETIPAPAATKPTKKPEPKKGK